VSKLCSFINLSEWADVLPSLGVWVGGARDLAGCGDGNLLGITRGLPVYSFIATVTGDSE
jgi:hypothetical protein